MWRDIIEANADQVAAALKQLEEQLSTVKGYILRGDYDGLQQYLSDAAARRSRRFDGASGGGLF
jgi:prephenate dehydrogenase